MKIATPLLALFMIAMSVVFVRQARRAWRDPDWEPASTAQSPRSIIPATGLMISFAVMLTGGAVMSDLPFAAPVGAAGVALGMLCLILSLIALGTTGRFGRPRFLVPPPLRPGYAQTSALGPTGPTIAEIQATEAARAFGAVQAVIAHGADPAAVGLGPASAPVDTAQADDFADARTGGEFIVIAGRGSHVAGDVTDPGRLVLTTHRLVLSTLRPDLDGWGRVWPVADIQSVSPGPGEAGLTLRLADGRDEVFTVDKGRDRWLERTTRLLSLPQPVRSWYGDPADATRSVAVPDGKAVLVLWRAQAEWRDRLAGYRVMLDGRRAAKLKRGRCLELPIEPGRHTVYLRSVWVGSRLIPFEARLGEAVRFACEPGGFPGMTQADMERDVTGYIRLRRL